MTSLDKLKTTSKRARVGLFIVLAITICIAVYGYLKEGVWWVTIGDGQFQRLWKDYPDSQGALSLIMLPVFIVLVTGIYRLQRVLQLFGEGHFFSTDCMQNLKWLAWLSVSGVAYNMFWPLLATPLLVEGDTLGLNIRPLTLIMLLCLPLLVHLLSAAGDLNRENSEFV